MASPIASPATLADLVSYQAGSVVSRVLLRGEGGSHTVFAFADGEGLSEHTNPNDAPRSGRRERLAIISPGHGEGLGTTAPVRRRHEPEAPFADGVKLE